MHVVLQQRDQMANRELQAFLALQGLGGLGNIAMLATALLSTRVNRSTTWINFCVTWIIYTISYTLLFLAGQQTDTIGPAFPLCMIQAGLVYGAPILTTCSSMALVVQVWLSFRATPHSKSSEPFVALALIAFPYIPWLCMTLGALIVCYVYTEAITRAQFGLYCTISSAVPGYVSSALVVVTLLVAVSFQILIIRIIYKHVRIQKQAPHQVSNSMVARLGLFILWSMLSICIVAVFVSKNYIVANIYIAMMPVIAFVLFATQRDILRVWTFRE